MKKWCFAKKEHNFVLIIEDNGKVMLQIDNEKPFKAKSIENDAVAFYGKHPLSISGETKYIDGINLDHLDNHNEIKEYYDHIIEKLAADEKEAHDREFNAILNGEKPLDIVFNDGEYFSGHIVYGVSADVVRFLHCGHQMCDGYVLDKEFEDGNIEKMKAHYEDWKTQREKEEVEKRLEEEKYKREKEEFLEGINWETQECKKEDEGGKTIKYIHTLLLNGKTYVFSERNVFDVGRVINPEYEIVKGSKGGLAKCENNKWFWMDFVSGKGYVKTRDMDKDEEHAYLAVQKYGKFAKSNIRM